MKGYQEIVRTVLSTSGSEKVEFIIVYGSKAGPYGREGSDLDICVHFSGEEDERSEFRFRVLRSLMDDDIDVHIYRDLPLYIRKDVFKGEVLYMKDQVKLIDLAYREMREFEDFESRYHDYIGMGEIG